MNRRFSIICTLSACLGASPVLAAPLQTDMGSLVRTEHVRYADLDLTSTKGRERLERRVKNAVKTVCTIPIATRLISIREQRCVNLATINGRASTSIAVARAYQRHEAETLLAQR